MTCRQAQQAQQAGAEHAVCSAALSHMLQAAAASGAGAGAGAVLAAVATPAAVKCGGLQWRAYLCAAAHCCDDQGVLQAVNDCVDERHEEEEGRHGDEPAGGQGRPGGQRNSVCQLARELMTQAGTVCIWRATGAAMPAAQQARVAGKEACAYLSHSPSSLRNWVCTDCTRAPARPQRGVGVVEARDDAAGAPVQHPHRPRDPGAALQHRDRVSGPPRDVEAALLHQDLELVKVEDDTRGVRVVWASARQRRYTGSAGDVVGVVGVVGVLGVVVGGRGSAA